MADSTVVEGQMAVHLWAKQKKTQKLHGSAEKWALFIACKSSYIHVTFISHMEVKVGWSPQGLLKHEAQGENSILACKKWPGDNKFKASLEQGDNGWQPRWHRTAVCDLPFLPSSAVSRKVWWGLELPEERQERNHSKWPWGGGTSASLAPPAQVPRCRVERLSLPRAANLHLPNQR